MATTGTYDNVISAGAASVTVGSIIGGATGYTVYDITGTVIATGAVSGSSVTIPAPGGSWPAGWFLCLLTIPNWNGVYGHASDAVGITAVRSGVATLPPVPASGTSPSASDLNSRGLDLYMHAFTAMGPERWEIHDAANPTVYTAGTEQGGTVAAIQANLALNQGAAGYTNPTYADSSRPRPEFVTFPNNQQSETGFAAGVAAAVAALGPGTSANVTYFQGLNEPSQQGLTPAQSAAYYNAFRTAVKAGNSQAKAMGPAEVAYGPTGSDFHPWVDDFVTWLNNVTPGTVDALSLHEYNAYNGDFLVTDKWFGDIRTALANAGYPANLPIWLTEMGTGTAWGMYPPHRLIAWTAQLYLTAERFGIPKEQMFWFFDFNIGFDQDWLKEATGDLRPFSTFFRVYSEEVFGKTYTGPLTFGTVGDKFYRGNIYRGAAGTCVALTAQGNPGDTVTLAVSDTGTITYSDWQGQTHTVTVSGGKITVPILHLPTYVRLSAGCTVTVADVGNGLSGTVTNIATTATITSSTGSANPGYVNDGAYRTGGYMSGTDLVYKSSKMPDALTLTWGTPQTIKKIVIRQVPPWFNYNGSCAMTTGKLEYWNGSGWLPCPTVAARHWDNQGHYHNTTATAFLGQVGGSPAMVTWYDQNWCHNVDFATCVTTTKLRWTVTATGYGDVPNKDAATYAPFNFIGSAKQQLMCSQIIVVPGPPVAKIAPFLHH